MNLKKIEKTIYEVNIDDFEEFVKSIYGGEPEIIANQELNNSSYLSFNVPDKYPTSYSNEELKKTIRNGGYEPYCFSTLVECLIEDGHLEDGEYFILISW